MVYACLNHCYSFIISNTVCFTFIFVFIEEGVNMIHHCVLPEKEALVASNVV